MDVQLHVASKAGVLGFVRISLIYKSYEQAFIAQLLECLRVELCQHWHRVKILVDQKLLDYRYLMEQTRSEILERFLTHVLVAKFQDNRTMAENLSAVLTPRPTRAALMQADIRGYSKISALLNPEEMVRLLQGYFRNVVDAAQLVAQVKLIGDCIFLFIEEGAGPPGTSPADLALDLAAILVAETVKQNALRGATGGSPLTFGIAVHYGEVVVGNLSSDSCIDYTVIGPNVNFVARLEELTKSPQIAELIGPNGTLLSPEALRALNKHAGLIAPEIALEPLQLTIRSFPHVQRVIGLTADAVLGLAAPEAASGVKSA